MAPVVLQTDVHCFKCARKIREAIWNLFGVERVSASPETGLVVVAGTADASLLRRRIQRKIRRRVTILSDGTVPWAPDTSSSHYVGMRHLAPPPRPYYSHPPAGYYYPPPPYGGGNHYDYVPNAAPTCSIL